MSLLLMSVYALLVAGISAQRELSPETLLRRAAQEGTPLVDPVEDGRRDVQVTFVWRGSADTKNIAVIGTFLKSPIVAMTRIHDSNVWHVSAKVPPKRASRTGSRKTAP